MSTQETEFSSTEEISSMVIIILATAANKPALYVSLSAFAVHFFLTLS
jgi:hypothetical protein